MKIAYLGTDIVKDVFLKPLDIKFNIVDWTHDWSPPPNPIKRQKEALKNPHYTREHESWIWWNRPKVWWNFLKTHDVYYKNSNKKKKETTWESV